MADNPEPEVPSLDTLARRYLELWQDQWAALAVDPEVAENFSRLFQLLGQGAAAVAPFTPFGLAASYQRTYGHDVHFTQAGGDAAPRSQAARPPHGGDPDDAAQLAQRLAALEKRLDALEAGSARPRRRTPGSTRRRRS